MDKKACPHFWKNARRDLRVSEGEIERLSEKVKRKARSEKRVTTKKRAPKSVESETVIGPRTIGVLQERSLHAALKKWCAREGDALEVPLNGFHIDIVRGDLLIEIQTRNFFALKRKLPKLLEQHRVRLIHPIAVEKWLVRVAADGETEIGRRRSPKRGTFEDIFDELVHIPQLLAHSNFSLEILLIREEEIRRVRGALERPAKRTRFPRDWDRHDHRLLEVVDSRVIESLDDLRAFLPNTLPAQFTNRDLARALGNNYPRAQSMTYVMRQIGILEMTGKRGRAILYSLQIELSCEQVARA